MEKDLSTKKYAEKLGISARRVTKLCKDGRVPGAYKVSGVWLIPSNAKDRRRRTGRPMRCKTNVGVDM